MKAADHNALPKWGDAENALRHVTMNEIDRFFNYHMKLKWGKDGRRRKGIGTALTAEWKFLQGYYRNITRTSFYRRAKWR